MKTPIVLGFLLFTGCGGMGWTSDVGALKKQVSFDHNCPIDKIQIQDSMEGGIGKASFKIDACGQNLRYERMGTGYFDTAKGTPLDQAMGKTAEPSATPSASASPGTP